MGGRRRTSASKHLEGNIRRDLTPLQLSSQSVRALRSRCYSRRVCFCVAPTQCSHNRFFSPWANTDVYLAVDGLNLIKTTLKPRSRYVLTRLASPCESLPYDGSEVAKSSGQMDFINVLHRVFHQGQLRINQR